MLTLEHPFTNFEFGSKEYKQALEEGNYKSFEENSCKNYLKKLRSLVDDIFKSTLEKRPKISQVLDVLKGSNSKIISQ